MRVMVVGGTHLGIVGFYGKKVFDVESLDQIEEAIRNDHTIPPHGNKHLLRAKKSSYIAGSGRTIHTLVDKKGQTLFEYYVESILD